MMMEIVADRSNIGNAATETTAAAKIHTHTDRSTDTPKFILVSFIHAVIWICIMLLAMPIYMCRSGIQIHNETRKKSKK